MQIAAVWVGEVIAGRAALALRRFARTREGTLEKKDGKRRHTQAEGAPGGARGGLARLADGKHTQASNELGIPSRRCCRPGPRDPREPFYSPWLTFRRLLRSFPKGLWKLLERPLRESL